MSWNGPASTGCCPYRATRGSGRPRSDLAYGRGGISLWQRLGERADTRPEFGAAREQLTALLSMADFATPHRYLETILSGPMDGRRKVYGRLGMAARDPIDELLASALEFEQQETASLDRFLAWFAQRAIARECLVTYPARAQMPVSRDARCHP